MSSRDGPSSEADEHSLTPAQVQRARDAIDYLSTIPFRGNVRDSGMYMTNWYHVAVLTNFRQLYRTIMFVNLISICMIYDIASPFFFSCCCFKWMLL